LLLKCPRDVHLVVVAVVWPAVAVEETPDDGMATFNNALASGNVADFNTVIPNGCEDGEANC
jgi:hypothetical protein